MIKSKWIRMLALAMVLTLLAACGGDDEESEDSGSPEENQTTEAADGDLAAFCDSIIRAESEFIAASTGNPTGDPAASIEEAQSTAPEDIQADVDTVGELALQALETQEDPSEDPAFRTADENIDQYVLDNCEVETVDVAGVEYAFEGLPETVPAGPVGFNFTNEGEELHEMIVARINDPSNTVEDILDMPEKEQEGAVTPVMFNFAEPGNSDAQTIQLDAGSYAVVCFVSVGTTSEEERGDGPPHVAEGMYGQFTVE